ncbi:unnamed protein product [Trichobilharzia regenti]|nr:unnamed protein product [Trichobilharzia regenti]
MIVATFKTISSCDLQDKETNVELQAVKLFKVLSVKMPITGGIAAPTIIPLKVGDKDNSQGCIDTQTYIEIVSGNAEIECNKPIDLTFMIYLAF